MDLSCGKGRLLGFILELKLGVQLHLKDGATLLFSSHPDDYLPVVLTRWEGTEMPDVNKLRKMGDELTPVSERVFGKGTCLRPCAIEMNYCS